MPLEVRGPDGRLLPFQRIKTEHTFLTNIPWRVRVLANVRLPALGWGCFTFGWVEGAKAPAIRSRTGSPRAHSITNGSYRVEARRGRAGVALFHGARRLLGPAGLGAITVDDAFGSWGALYDEADGLHLLKIRQAWTVTGVEVVERGPLRAGLWVRLAGGSSSLDLFFRLTEGRDAIDVEARLLWNETRARLKLVFPGAGDQAEFEVPGGVVRRGPAGEVPGGRWVRIKNGAHTLGLASDHLYGFDSSGGTFRASVVRSARYCFDARDTPATPEWLPMTDRGEYRFNFLLTANGALLPQLARELEQPVHSLAVPPHPGRLGRSGSLVELTPTTVRLLAFKPAEDGQGLIVRVQETAGRAARPSLTLAGKRIMLPRLPAHRIATYRLQRGRVAPVLLSELPKASD